MSQARVTDFFSTRKRNRFNQDEVLLNKQNKTTVLLDEAPVTEKLEVKLTRSRAKQLAKVDSITNQSEQEATKLIEDVSVEKKTTRGTACARKKQLEELKQRADRLDEKLAKLKKPDSKGTVSSLEQNQTVEKEIPKEEELKFEKKKQTRRKVNMSELKERIQRFNENLIAVQENFSKTAEVKAASQSEETPKPESHAFKKFKDLASSEIDIQCTLTLPTSYAQLMESFKGSDTIVKFLFNRQEVCTFLKLKMGIQNITKHTFSLKNLGQIKHVYENAYVFKQEKMFIDFKNDYHLTIYPNLEEIDLNPDTQQKEFSPAVLLKRLNMFKKNLFQIVKNYHKKFLESIGIENVDSKQIKRWHPKFDLEGVKEIEDAELPKSPNESIKCKTGQELLNIAKDVYSSRIQEAIKDFVTAEKSLTVEKRETITATTKKVEIKIIEASKKTEKELNVDERVLNNLQEKKTQTYSTLLEKIRNKEKTKAFETMVLNSDREKKLAKYNNYKEAVRFLLFFFQSEKKSTLEFDKVSIKLADNLKSKLGEFECRELLNEMCNEENFKNDNTKWISLIKVRNLNYIKMDKSFQLNDLWTVCDKLIKELN